MDLALPHGSLSGTTLRYGGMALLCAALLAAVYYPVKSASFVYEDWNGAGIESDAPMAIQPLRTRALTRLSYRIDRWFGPNATSYHVHNVVLHGINGGLVAAVAVPLVGGVGAVIAASVFLGLTLNVEAVAYIASRTELLSLTFLLLACLWTLRVPTTGWRTWRVVSVVLALTAAMWTKESAICGLGLVWLCGEHTGRGPCFSWPVWQRHWRLILGTGVVLGVVAGLLVRTVLQQEYWAIVHSMYSPWRYAAVQATAFWAYLGMVVYPHGFSIDHDYEIVPLAVQAVALGGFIWLWMLTVLLWLGRDDLFVPRPVGVCLFGILWVLITVSLRFMMRIPEMLNEHQFYGATVGVALIISAGVSPLFTKRELA